MIWWAYDKAMQGFVIAFVREPFGWLSTVGKDFECNTPENVETFLRDVAFTSRTAEFEMLASAEGDWIGNSE